MERSDDDADDSLFSNLKSDDLVDLGSIDTNFLDELANSDEHISLIEMSPNDFIIEYIDDENNVNEKQPIKDKPLVKQSSVKKRCNTIMCSAPNCQNRSTTPNTTLFSVPYCHVTRRAWRKRLKMNKNFPKYAFLCHKHFDSRDIYIRRNDGKVMLKLNAVPLRSSYSEPPTQLLSKSEKRNLVILNKKHDKAALSFDPDCRFLNQYASKNSGSTMECAHCGSLFKRKNWLICHFKICKKNPDRSSDKRRMKFNCSICGDVLKSYEKLREHFTDKHQIKIKFQAKHFPDEKSFEDWKAEVEYLSCANYVRRSMDIVKMNGSVYVRLHCSRTGYFKTTAALRSVKRNGTVKMNGVCPSTMNFSRNIDGSIDVKYYSTHVGHDNDLKKCMLSKEDRRLVAEKLLAGYSITDIVNDDTILSHRFRYLTKKDVHNIKVAFNITYPIKLLDENVTCLQSWLYKKNGCQRKCVLFYKRQDTPHSILNENDFVLALMTKRQAELLFQFGHLAVAVEELHKLFSSHFQVFIVIVTSPETKRAIPVATLITNRTDQSVYRIFFESLRTKVSNIETDIFISDHYPDLYDTWKNVMGPAKKRLLCDWHVMNEWQNKVRTYIKGTRNKDEVLCTLMQLKKCATLNTVHCSLYETMHKLNEPDVAKFGKFFAMEYAHCIEQWVDCYRPKRFKCEAAFDQLRRLLKKRFFVNREPDRPIYDAVMDLMDLFKERNMENFIQLRYKSKKEEECEIMLDAEEYDAYLEDDNDPLLIEISKEEDNAMYDGDVDLYEGEIESHTDENSECDVEVVYDLDEEDVSKSDINENKQDAESVVSVDESTISVTDKEIQQRLLTLSSLSTDASVPQSMKRTVLNCLGKAIETLKDKDTGKTYDANLLIQTEFDQIL